MTPVMTMPTRRSTTTDDSLAYVGAGPLLAILLGIALIPFRESTTASNLSFAFLERIPAQVVDTDTLLAPGLSESTLSRAPSLPSEGARMAIVTHHRQIAWLDLWGDGAPATAASRRTLSDVARILGTMRARSS